MCWVYSCCLSAPSCAREIPLIVDHRPSRPPLGQLLCAGCCAVAPAQRLLCSGRVTPLHSATAWLLCCGCCAAECVTALPTTAAHQQWMDAGAAHLTLQASHSHCRPSPPLSRPPPSVSSRRVRAGVGVVVRWAVSHRPPPPLLSGSPLVFLLSHPPPFAGLANVLLLRSWCWVVVCC